MGAIMTKTLRIALLGVFSTIVFLAVLPFQGPAQDEREKAWIKSGDPCWPNDQLKAQIKATYGVTADYLKCKPLRINMDWDIDETFHHHSDLGDDHLRAKIRVSFRGYINLNYNQQKRSQLDDYLILGPAPCCPGMAQVDPTSLQASVLGWRPKGFSSQEFKMFEFSGGADILTRTDKAGFFSLKWRRDGLERKTELSGPAIGLARGAVPKPYSFGTPVWIMDHHNYHLEKPVEPPSWEELKPIYDKQGVWRKQYDFGSRTDFPVGPLLEFYALRGKVAVEVDFSEEEEEEWQMSVEGKEKDETSSILGPLDVGTSVKPGPLAVEFSWSLGAKITTRKRKGVRTLVEAVITRFDQSPKLIFSPGDPFHYDFVACGGQLTYEQAQKFVGLSTEGSVQGQNINIKWPFLPARACILGKPNKSSAGKAVYRKELGSKEFTTQVSGESLPLRDGAVRTGGLGKWLTYRITLKKLG